MRRTALFERLHVVATYSTGSLITRQVTPTAVSWNGAKAASIFYGRVYMSLPGLVVRRLRSSDGQCGELSATDQWLAT
jgi:hypothetical protein